VRLTEKLAGIPGIRPHKVIKGGYGTYWFYLIQIDSDVLGVDPATFVKAVNAEGIPGGTGYVGPVYLTYEYLRKKTAFSHSRWPFTLARKSLKYGPGYCPNAETVMRNSLNFGIREELSAREIDDTAAAVRKVAAHYRSKR
jgi:dTDP-4-amino-4,6-dideoxygalactose transaminase